MIQCHVNYASTCTNNMFLFATIIITTNTTSSSSSLVFVEHYYISLLLSLVCDRLTDSITNDMYMYMFNFISNKTSI